MKAYFRRVLGSMTIILLLAANPARAEEPLLSANIPLESTIYSSIDKLEGMGYLDAMPTGSKPYRRVQVARWVRSIQAAAAAKGDLPSYVQHIIEQLTEEFRPELSVLDGKSVKDDFGLTTLNWTSTLYDGRPLAQHRTVSSYQPLHINTNGYRLADGFNTTLALGIEGSLHPRLFVNLTPDLLYSDEGDLDLNLASGYLKTRLGNMEIQLGKDAIWWGQGERGSLLLTNNSEPKTALRLSTLEPMVFDGWLWRLGQAEAAFFYTELGDDRSDIRDPSFVGWRLDFTPSSNLTFGLALSSIVGGEGRELNSSDIWHFIIGRNGVGAEEKWNSIAGIDLRWRIPALRGMQIYSELYGEDQAGKIPFPSKNAGLLGIYLPRLTSDGSWDLTLEAAKTVPASYGHSLYRDGYTDDGLLMGDAMGNNAQRFYTRLTHYFTNGSRLALHGEYVTMDVDASFPQNATSVWASYQTTLNKVWMFNVTMGVSFITNPDYQDGQSSENYLLGVGFKRTF